MIFFALIFGHQCLGSPKDACTKLLNAFIEAQKSFDQCALKHAVPVNMCQECVQPYVSIVQTFYDLSTTPDPHSVRHKCVDQFINHNTLNIVWSQYQTSRNLWNEAACTSCFVEACNPDKMTAASNVTEICKLNKNVLDIRNKTDNLMKCFNTSDHNVGSNCIDCLNSFNSIANKYKELGKSSHEICFDVVDQFNQTNNIWYDEKHCPRPTVVPHSVAWIVIIVFACLFTAGCSIFGGYFLFTKYRQRGNVYAEHTDSDDGTATPPIYS